MYPGSGEYTTEDEIETYEYYSSSLVTNNRLDIGFPYLSTGLKDVSGGNNCSPTAGMEIITFFDYYYPELIYGVTPTTTIYGSGWPYYFTEYKDYEYYTNNTVNTINFEGESTTEDDIMRDLNDKLYVDMLTNENEILGLIPHGGTFPPYFYDALEDYFFEHGYITHTVGLIGDENSPASIQPWDIYFPWEDFKDEIDLNRPVVLQLGVDPSPVYRLIEDKDYEGAGDGNLDIYVFYDWELIDGLFSDFYYDLIMYKYQIYNNVAHTVVGVGYRETDFYRKNIITGNVYLDETTRFIEVADGWGSMSLLNADDGDVSIAYSIYLEQMSNPDGHLDNYSSSTSRIYFDVNFTDENSFIDYTQSKILLKRNGIVVSEMSLPIDGTRKYFGNLLSNTYYDIELFIVYKKGDGVHEVELEADTDTYKTLNSISYC